jgi:hypothetical protein
MDNPVIITIADLEGNIIATYNGLDDLPNKYWLRKLVNKGLTDVEEESMFARIQTVAREVWEAVGSDWAAAAGVKPGSMKLGSIVQAVLFSIQMHGTDEEAVTYLFHSVSSTKRTTLLKAALADFAAEPKKKEAVES